MTDIPLQHEKPIRLVNTSVNVTTTHSMASDDETVIPRLLSTTLTLLYVMILMNVENMNTLTIILARGGRLRSATRPDRIKLRPEIAYVLKAANTRKDQSGKTEARYLRTCRDYELDKPYDFQHFCVYGRATKACQVPHGSIRWESILLQMHRSDQVYDSMLFTYEKIGWQWGNTHARVENLQIPVQYKQDGNTCPLSLPDQGPFIL